MDAVLGASTAKPSASTATGRSWLLALLAPALAALVVLGGTGLARAAVFNPIADTYTRSDCKSCNYGTGTYLRLDQLSSNGISYGYLNFNLVGLQAAVSSATLRLYAIPTNDTANTSSAAVQLYGISNTSWTEAGLTWRNAPAMGSLVATSPSFPNNSWGAMSATPLVTGNGLLSMGLVSTDPTSARWMASRENTNGNGPQLVIPPTVTLAAPSTGGTTSFSGAAGTASGTGVAAADQPTVTLNIYAGSAATATPVQTLTVQRSNGAWKASAALSDGTYTAVATQLDAANNMGTSVARTFTVDTTPPAVTLTSPTSGSSLRTSSPTLSGAAGNAAGDNATVSVSIWSQSQYPAGLPVQTQTVTRSGSTWSVAASPSLPDGTYVAQASQSDAAGNTGTSSAVTFTVDTVAPTVSVSAPAAGATLATGQPGFSGGGGTASGDSTNATVSVYAGSAATGTPVQAITAPVSGGTWSAAPSSPLPDGTYTLQATQSDAAGNVGASAPVTFTVDTTPPAVTITAPGNGSMVGASPTMSGGAGTAPGDAANVTVKLYSGTSAGGTALQTLTATVTNGAWSAAPSAPLTDGSTYTVQATQSDAAGNVGTTSAITFTVDATPPAVTLTAPASGALTTATPSFSGGAGTATGDNPAVTVSIYSGPVATGTPVQTLSAGASAGTWSATAAHLGDGTYTVQARQTDLAGNVGTSAATTFTVDTTPPAVTLTSPASGSSVNSSTPAFAGAAGTAPGDSSTVTVSIYAGTAASGTPVEQFSAIPLGGSWTASASTPLADGTYTAQATQTDAASNTGASAPATFTVDTVAPVVTLAQPVNGSTTGASPTFSGIGGTAPGDASHVSVQIFSGTTPVGPPVQTATAALDPTGNWSLTATPLPNGTYTAEAVQSDAAGNTGTSAAVTFSAAGVGVSLDRPAGGSLWNTATPTFSGSASDGGSSAPTVTVDVYAGSAASGSPIATLSTMESGGSWSLVPSSPLPDGTLTAQALQSDTAGNVGASAARTFTIDTTAPAPTVTAPANGGWTASASPQLSGTAGTATGDSSSVSVAIYAGQTATGTPAQTLSGTASGGTWSVTPQTPLPDGTYAATVTQSDAAGNTGVSPATTFTVDTTAPTVSITTPASGSSLASSTPSLAGRAGVAPGDSATVTVKVFSGAQATGTPVQTLSATQAGGGWSAGPSSLSDGTYTVLAVQSDAAGNVGTSSATTFTVDTTPPALTLTSPAGGSTVATGTPMLSGAAGTASGDSGTVTVMMFAGTTATGSATQTLTAQVSGGTWSAKPTSPLADGAWTVQATQSDAAGNGTTVTGSFTVDTTPPAVTITVPAAGAWLQNATPTFSGAAGTAPGDSATVSVGVYAGSAATGSALQTLTATVQNGTWTVNASGKLSDGTYTAQATQSDAAGNTGRSAVTFTVDTTPPALTLTSPSAATINTSQPTFGGAAGTAAGDSTTVAVRVFAGSSATGTPVQTMPATASGSTWSVGASSALSDGIYTVQATQSDAAGNTATASRTFTIDTVAPAVSLSSPAAGTTVAASANITGSGGTATGDASTVTVNLYPGSSASGTPAQTFTAPVSTSGSWSVAPSNLFSEGQYTAQAVQTDAVGNTGTSAAITFTAKAPVVDAAGDIACDPTDSNYNGGNGTASGCQEKATAALLNGADRVFPIGDTQYDASTTSNYQQVYNPTWGAFKSITLPTIGNHEYQTSDGVAGPYYAYFGASAGSPSQGWWSANVGSWHVISLNSNCSAIGGCQAGSPQEQWLKSDLAADHAHCTLALWHAPRFSSASSQSDSTYQPFWQDLYNEGADLSLVGHMHNYERFAPQTATGVLDTAHGIREIVVGDGGKALVPFTSVLPNSQVRNASVFGVLQVTLHATSYDWNFKSIAGSTFTDSGTQACHN